MEILTWSPVMVGILLLIGVCGLLMVTICAVKKLYRWRTRRVTTK